LDATVADASSSFTVQVEQWRVAAAKAQQDVVALRAELEQAERWANTMEHERDWERDVVHSELLQRAEAAEKERDLAREEVRIREETQIPVIPRAAADRLRRMEALAEAVKRHLDDADRGHPLGYDDAYLRNALESKP
jgi:hypothetical protein